VRSTEVRKQKAGRRREAPFIATRKQLRLQLAGLSTISITMSRESWYELTGSSASDWREASQHKPLKGRTTDPEALEYDEASELFLHGIKLARRGDLDAGRSQIATAYLLDGRSINFMPLLPQGEEKEAADLALDPQLLFQLIS